MANSIARRALARHVRRENGHAIAQAIRQLEQRLGPPADRDHARALVDQLLDDPSPDAGSPARHQCDFARETAH